MKTANRALKTIERFVRFMAGQEENLPGLDDDQSCFYAVILISKKTKSKLSCVISLKTALMLDSIIQILHDETATALSVTNQWQSPCQ